jgi:hypothetical protein
VLQKEERVLSLLLSLSPKVILTNKTNFSATAPHSLMKLCEKIEFNYKVFAISDI